MWFSLFRSHDTPSDRQAQPSPGSWPWGVADEVEAFFAGRLVDHLVAIGRRVPAWAVLNRLAHSTHEAPVELVQAEGASSVVHPAYRQRPRVMAAEALDSFDAGT